MGTNRVDQLYHVFNSQLFSLFVALILATAAFGGKLSMSAAAICLVLAWFVGCVGIYKSDVIKNWYLMVSAWLALGSILALLASRLLPPIPISARGDAAVALGPDALIHPPSDGVLWRWSPEIAADGPFCPTHPQARLFLKGKYGGQKWKDFEADYLTYNWFTCPINQSEDFKSLEQHALRVYQLRAQATARFRAIGEQQALTTLSKNEEDTKGLLEIEQTRSEILWRSNLGGGFNPLSNNNEVPHNVTFFLQISVKITATPPRLVEEIWLELTREHINDADWIPERINSPREVHVRFRLPSSIGQGKYPAQLIVKALGANKEIIERRSRSFEVIIAHSYFDLQKFSGTS